MTTLDRSPSDRPRPGLLLPAPGTVADAFVACLVLLQGTAVGFIAAGGRGRLVEVIVTGASTLVAYLARWRIGRLVSVAAGIAYLVLEWHFGRLWHSGYWHEVFLTAGVVGSVLAAAYLRLTVETRNAGLGAELERYEARDQRDALELKLGGARRLGTLAFELERARRHNHCVSLLLVRPDDFDEISLRYGDIGAIETLGAVAEAIGRCLRATDIPLREGAFDFAIVLPETEREEARVVAERIRLAASSKRLELGPGEVVDLDVAVGAATFPHDATTNDELMAAVHRALGAAVALGGNRTILYSLPEGSPSGWVLAEPVDVAAPDPA